MSDSLFLPRELFTAASVPATSRLQAPPTDAVLDDLRRITTPVATFGNGQKNRRRKPRDPNAPKVDLWLDLAA
ncbi:MULTISPECIES: hypothetical protein [unclassified Rhizobacter]|uniref:hypothetical protein n=1 Tax=unclassified Rhizobacter TaxID=2640088 RepID=UPI0006F69188|nr:MULTISPECIES: hypothetical protein [unclassified Rhizobacter]KQU79003.1 hypothetical protein ASC88_18130 [Rhizobacter sp. Root29]KQW13498.1 hypothetical protein ASC98_18350 [Rhizobacter sp. Root1238]KRB06292.1 hypothetical protein ASE08_11560 [Rhizobacter sp. Root16D2]